MSLNKSPCIEKQCSRCCDSVKVYKWTPIPKDEYWNDLWENINEVRIPEKHPDTVRLEVYNCLWYDKDQKKCKEYSKRPEICNKTNCIDWDKNISIDKQHKEMIEQGFIKIIKK